MTKQVSIKLISSAALLALSATGCETLSIPGTSGASSATHSTVSAPSAQETQAAIAISTGDHKDRYKPNELANDSLYQAVDISTNRLAGIPTPVVSVANNSYIPTVIIPKVQDNPSDQLDVSLLDDFIDSISPSARHYPPNFNSPSDRYYAKEKLKELEQWLRPFAENEQASYEVLLRAAKLNGMGRNLDLGSDYAIRASTFIAKAIDRQPNSAEANFIYGMMLSEGGGFKEGRKYLLKAAEQNYMEAEQSIAQADLLSDDRPAALSRLKKLQQQHPDNTTIAQQIAIIESGKYYIWDLPAN